MVERTNYHGRRDSMIPGVCNRCRDALVFAIENELRNPAEGD